MIGAKEVRFYKPDRVLEEKEISGQNILAVENSYDGSTKVTIGSLPLIPGSPPEVSVEFYVEPEGYSIMQDDIEWFPNQTISMETDDLVIPEDPEAVRLQEAVEEDEALDLDPEQRIG